MSSKRSLKEELALRRGKQVYIGARSSFFFIGPSEEAMRDLPLLGLLSRYCVTMSNRRRLPRSAASCPDRDIGSRQVAKVFVRDYASCGNEIAIIISGREFGVFWTRDEYLAGKEAFLKELDRLRSEKQATSRDAASE